MDIFRTCEQNLWTQCPRRTPCCRERPRACARSHMLSNGPGLEVSGQLNAVMPANAGIHVLFGRQQDVEYRIRACVKKSETAPNVIPAQAGSPAYRTNSPSVRLGSRIRACEAFRMDAVRSRSDGFLLWSVSTAVHSDRVSGPLGAVCRVIGLHQAATARRRWAAIRLWARACHSATARPFRRPRTSIAPNPWFLRSALILSMNLRRRRWPAPPRSPSAPATP